jgi:hypothetical protein
MASEWCRVVVEQVFCSYNQACFINSQYGISVVKKISQEKVMAMESEVA